MEEEDSLLNTVDNEIYKLLWKNVKPSRIIKDNTQFRIKRFKQNEDKVVLVCKIKEFPCKAKVCYWKSLGECKTQEGHSYGCKFWQSSSKVSALEAEKKCSTLMLSLYKAYERYLTRKKQVEDPSDESQGEDEEMLDSVEAQKQHEEVLKGLKNLDKIPVKEKQRCVLAEVEQNLAHLNQPETDGKMTYAEGSEDELPIC